MQLHFCWEFMPELYACQASAVLLNYNHSPIFNFSMNFSVVAV